MLSFMYKELWFSFQCNQSFWKNQPKNVTIPWPVYCTYFHKGDSSETSYFWRMCFSYSVHNTCREMLIYKKHFQIRSNLFWRTFIIMCEIFHGHHIYCNFLRGAYIFRSWAKKKKYKQFCEHSWKKKNRIVTFLYINVGNLFYFFYTEQGLNFNSACLNLPKNLYGRH